MNNIINFQDRKCKLKDKFFEQRTSEQKIIKKVVNGETIELVDIDLNSQLLK